MATTNFTAGQFQSFLNSGAVNNGGDVAFFVADGTYSTAKTTYTTSALSTPNAHPKVLDAAGRATIYFSGDADVRVRDSSGVTVYTQRNCSPQAVRTTSSESTDFTVGTQHVDSVIETTAGLTATLTSAATLGAGFAVTLVNSSSGNLTIGRANAGNTINGTAANITISPNSSVELIVNAAATGFISNNSGGTVNITGDQTVAGIKAFTGANTHTNSEVFSGTPSINLTGGQIKFPATQSASADTNTLDDYEEGTFSLTASASTSGTITLSANTCYYTKIGNFVSARGVVLVQSVSSPVGDFTLVGLPFTANNPGNSAAAINIESLISITTENIFAYTTSTSIMFKKVASGGASGAMAANIQSGTLIRFSVSSAV